MLRKNLIPPVLLALVISSGLQAMQLGVNGWFLNDWVATMAFKDLINESRIFWCLEQGDDRDYPHTNGIPLWDWKTGEYAVPCDKDNYPLEIPANGIRAVAKLMMTDWDKEIVGATRPTGTYTLMVEGTGEIRIRCGREGTDWVFTPQGGESIFEFDIDDPVFQYLNLRITRSEKGDHIRNIRVIMPDPSGGTSFVDNYESDPWHPAFLEELRPFAFFRFMDWGHTNENAIVNWEDRTTMTQETQDWHYGMAYEYMIDLCNRMNIDLWVCVPAKSNEDFWRNLAQLIHDRLEPQRRVYVEWGNEPWNWQFISYRYAVQRGTELGLGESWQAAGRFVVYNSVRIFKVFYEEFGEESDRLTTMVCGQHVNSGIMTLLIDAYQNPAINPENIKIDLLGGAPYLGGRNLEDLRNSIAQNEKWTNGWDYQAIEAGMSCVAYEGGQGMDYGADRYNYQEGMYDVYMDYLNMLAKHYDAFAHYAFIGQCYDGGCWGVKKYTGMPTSDSPKYRALYDWAEQNGQLKDKVPDAHSSVEVRTEGVRSGPVGKAVLGRNGTLYTVSIPAPQKGKLLQLTTPRGRTVLHRRLGAAGAVSFDTRELSPGMYVLTVGNLRRQFTVQPR